MSKLEQLTNLIEKWSSNKIAFPDSWSEQRQLGNYDISYKTYDGGSSYKNIVVEAGGIKFEINVRGDGVNINHPINKPITTAKALDIVQKIYTEAISIESMVEGQIELRTKIANNNREIARRKKENTEFKNTLKEYKGRV